MPSKFWTKYVYGEAFHMKVQNSGIKVFGWTTPQKDIRKDKVNPIKIAADGKFGDMYKIIKPKPT